MRFKRLKLRDILSLKVECGGMRADLATLAAPIVGLLIGLALSGCATTGALPPGTIETGKNLGCAAAKVIDQRCQAGIETNAETCFAAAVIARVCSAAENPTLLASVPGSGYTPRSTTVSYRAIPGGPEKTATGDPSADPWFLACASKSGPELAACLRSRFFPASPTVCAEYKRAFGVDTCGTPAGGWTRGPSNERWGSALQALNYFCNEDPAYIGSTGRAGGWDCESTAVEWARLGAFGGEAIVAEWLRRTEAPPAPRCGDHKRDPGETCENCPEDAGACPPPPPPPACAPPLVCGPAPVPCPSLKPAQRAELARVCGWVPEKAGTPSGRLRARCAAVVATVLGIDGLDAQIAGDASGAKQ